MPVFRVLFFATLREAAGVREVKVDLPAGSTVAQLKQALGERFPTLAPHLPNALIAVERSYAFEDDLLPADGGEVALFPPVSGGAEGEEPEESIQITVIFFAALRSITGEYRYPMTLPRGTTVGELKRILLARWPELEKSFDGIVVSIGPETATDEEVIPEGAQVGFFHPIAGGSAEEPPTLCLVTEAPLDLNDLLARITLPTTGAAAVFTGMVRAVTQRGQPHRTAYLFYEAYVPMAEAKMRQVANEIRERWPAVEGIAIVQRIGRLDPGTPTVLIACTAAHRDTGVFEAARYGIDRLKEIVPIWKKEVGPDGEAWVEGAYHPRRGD